MNTLADILSDTRIDSRDLVDLRADLQDRLGKEPAKIQEEIAEDIATITTIETESEQYAGDNMRDGIFFIARIDFVEYAKELADDIGAFSAGVSWPNEHIDWEKAAEALEQDYTEITIRGRKYLYR
jgi:hypothetical protein